METFLACVCKIYVIKGMGGRRIRKREQKEGHGGLVASSSFLTSLRSSFVGMLHSNDLSSRPGRRRAESIRSGRLEDDVRCE
jgi:hypothetical protein